jgi:hypothetical protein
MREPPPLTSVTSSPPSKGDDPAKRVSRGHLGRAYRPWSADLVEDPPRCQPVTRCGVGLSGPGPAVGEHQQRPGLAGQVAGGFKLIMYFFGVSYGASSRKSMIDAEGG